MRTVYPSILAFAAAVGFVAGTSSTNSQPAQVASAPNRAPITGAGNSHSPVFSADGKHVAFVSQANNLVTNDDLGPHLDLFVRDLVTSNTVLVSVSTNGFGGANDNIGLYTLSSNAQVIAFDTAASNLGAWDNNRVSDIYVQDLHFGGRSRVTWSAGDEGDGNANGPSYNPLISEDGRYIVFESLASNLVTNDFNDTNDIFIHDLETGVTELVSVNAGGTASPDGPSHSPSISADGLTVAFVSHATNLVEGVTNQLGEIFVRRVAGSSNLWAQSSHLPETHWRSPASGALEPYRASAPVLSADGRYVAFKTLGQAVRFDLNRSTNSILLSFTNTTVQGTGVDYFQFYNNPRLAGPAGTELISFSRDCRFAVFQTATNLWPYPGIVRLDFESLITNRTYHLPPGGTAGSGHYFTNIIPFSELVVTNYSYGSSRMWTQMNWIQVNSSGGRLFLVADVVTNFVPSAAVRSLQLCAIDLPDGSIQFLSTNRSGAAGLGMSSVIPAIPPDGSFAAWDSPDDNLVADDLNRAWDVFVRYVETGETHVISAAHLALSSVTGVAMSKIAGNQSTSGDGSRVVVLSLDSNLALNDTNRLTDAILRDHSAQTNAMISGRFPVKPVVGPALTDPTNLVFMSALSVDGRYAMFAGNGLDVRSGSFYGTNVFWRDLQLNTNDYVSGSTTGARPALSSDGLMVAYERVDVWTVGPGPIIYDANHGSDIMVRDYRTSPAILRLISGRAKALIPDGVTGAFTANGPSINPAFSPDSRWVIFQSLATDLTYDPGPVAAYQLYAREIDTYRIKRISYSGSEGTNVFPVGGGATNPVFSADARFVFFEGSTSNLIYRHDLLNDMDDTGTARRPNLVVCAGCANPSASSEGRFTAYESRPVPGGSTNVFVKDLSSEQVELISISMTGTNGNGPSFTPLLSHDARFVVFASRASDLVPGDNNRTTDIFVRDRLNGVTHCLSRNFAGTGTGNRVSSNPIMSADGRTVAFQSFASDLVPGDYNDTRDIFVVTLGGPDTDGDHMDDDWEMAYFSTLSRDGSGDFDNDGVGDLAEFRAGTNPANDASILRVLTLTTSLAAGPNPRRNTVLFWSAIPGKTYRVQFKADLNAPWTTLGADVTASSTSASLTDTIEAPGEPNNPHRFYRVLLTQ